MTAQKLTEWLSGLTQVRERPEKITVTRSDDDTDDLLVYRTVFATSQEVAEKKDRRAVRVRTMVRRKAHRRPVCPILTSKAEKEGVDLLTEDLPDYDAKVPCMYCQQLLFPDEGAWRGYLAQKLEEIILRPKELKDLRLKRLCRHCRRFGQFRRQLKKARGELRVRHQLKDLTEDQKRVEMDTLKVKWAEQYKQLRTELKKGGAPDAALVKYRQEVTSLLKEVG